MVAQSAAASSGNVVSFPSNSNVRYDMVGPYQEAAPEFRYAYEKLRREIPHSVEGCEQPAMDKLGDIALGEMSDSGDIDTSIYYWTEDAQGSRWQIKSHKELRADAQMWMARFAQEDISGSRPDSCIKVMTDLMVGQARYLARKPGLNFVPFRNAYLLIEKDGTLRAITPDKSHCIDYVIQADLDMSRVDPETMIYTPGESKEGGYWDKYVKSAFIDQDVHDYSREALSTVLLSQCYEKGIMLYGDGENGKSVMLHILRALAPRHTQSINLKRLVKNEFGTASLIGKRVALISEMPSRLTKDMQDALKNIISWDPMPAEKKGKDEFTFVPRVIVIGATNHFSEVSNHEHGFWRKIETIPFIKRVRSDQKIFDLHKHITGSPEELGQVIDWLLIGAVSLIKRGRWMPDEEKPAAVRKLSREQRRDTDSVAAWLFDVQLDYNATALTQKKFIYESYCAHVGPSGKFAISDSKFWQRMKEHFREFDFNHVGVQKSLGNDRPRCVNLVLGGVQPFVEPTTPNQSVKSKMDDYEDEPAPKSTYEFVECTAEEFNKVFGVDD